MKMKHSEHVHEAPDPAGIVRLMREHSFERSRTVLDYMEQVAERAKTQTGKDVRTSSAEAFVADLVSVGLLEEVE